ncbi:MAG: beta-aspartyl-peptidase [Myxococcota bacterium]|nr:beta-aspartyl-peptidase [Myxococcota bacterium]
MTSAHLLRNGLVYTPQGPKSLDILVIGNKLVEMSQRLPPLTSHLQCVEYDLDGRIVIPGIIDAHTHLTGGGGETGPGSRVPAVRLRDIVGSGVTSCVGVLGTDGTTRTVRDLVACAFGMRAEGISAWCYTGSYQYPVPTLTGSVRDDIVFIDPIIGVGELAISDHRSSQVTFQEFLRVASDCYVAGLMSGKAGLLHLHLGDGQREFQLIEQALDSCELPPRTYHPTHVNRKTSLYESSKDLAMRGVTVDLTAFPDAEGGLLAADAIADWIASDLPIERLTCSSDGGGCLPCFDCNGELQSMDIGRSKVLIETIQALLRRGYDFEHFLPVFTENVARTMRLPNKGKLEVGFDADLLVVEPDGQIVDVMANGEWFVRNEEPVRMGRFDKIYEENQ